LGKTPTDPLQHSADRSSRSWSLDPDLLEDLPVGIAVHRDGILLYANPHTARIVGVDDPGELVGVSVLDFLEPEEHEEVREEIRKVQGGEEVVVASYSIRRRDGEPRRVEVTALPMLYDGERAVQLLIRDVTHQHRAREALRRSERKWADLFDLSPLAMWLTTVEDARLLEVNDGWISFFGWERQEAVGRTEHELELWLFPERREEVVRRVRETGTAREVPVQLRTRGGKVRDALFFADLAEIDGQPCLLGLAHDVTEMRRFGRELARMALHDSLTGLPNRNLFRDRLDHALDRAERGGHRVAILFLDLDGFKAVNDTFGHPAGDLLLSAVARRLRSCFRDEDTVARFGGDEFAGLLDDLESVDEALVAADRVVAAFEEPFEVRGHRIDVAASIGIACELPGEVSGDDLLRYSDVAMYRAKERPGTRYHVFTAGRDALAAERLRREDELRRALERDELVVHYQPLVALADGSVVGAEALVRWRHPERGLVRPTHFLSLAEETGLIVPIGERVVQRALADAASWIESGAAPEDFRLAVNLSLRQIRQPDLPEVLAEALDRSGMPPRVLQLEVDESAIMQGLDRVEGLRELGVGVVVDDFGTGYSSMESLRHLRVEALKIDPTFVAKAADDPADEAIVRAIALVAEGLGLEVMAEGIEREAQRSLLLEIGCPVGQGLLFSPAVPADDLRDALVRGSV